MQIISVNELDWDTHNLLMPMSVRELMWNQQEQTADQQLLHREYAPESDLEMLLPAWVRG